jgi:hypothetical protein
MNLCGIKLMMTLLLQTLSLLPPLLLLLRVALFLGMILPVCMNM